MIRRSVFAASVGSTGAASAARCRSTSVRAAASSFVACCSKSARVPLRCFAALLGSFTPSIANISRLIRPCVSQTARTAANTWAMSAPERAHELGDRREVRRRVAAQRDERHVLPTRRLDPTAADDPVGVGDEHHLEQHRRRVGGRARLVVPKPRVEVREIDRVVEQVIHRVLERAGEQLPRQVDGQESRIRVDVLVAGHGSERGRNDRQPATPLQPAIAI